MKYLSLQNCIIFQAIVVLFWNGSCKTGVNHQSRPSAVMHQPGSPCVTAEIYEKQADTLQEKGFWAKSVDLLARAELLCPRHGRVEKLAGLLDDWGDVSGKQGNLYHEIIARKAAAALARTRDRELALLDATLEAGLWENAESILKEMMDRKDDDERNHSPEISSRIEKLQTIKTLQNVSVKKSGSTRAQIYLNEGLNLLSNHKAQEALKFFHKSLAKRYSTEALHKIGRTHRMTKNHVKARRFFSRAFFLAAQTATPVIETVLGHDGAVTAVSTTRDGRYIASGGADGNVRIWDTYTGTMTAKLTGHQGGVQHVSFSPPGNVLATSDRHGGVKIHRVPGGGLLAELQSKGATVSSLAFGPLGDRLAGSTSDGRIILWDLWTNKKMGELSERWPPDGALSVVFHPEGKLVAAGTTESVTLWNIEEKSIQKRYGEYFPTRIHALAFSPDGRKLLSGGSDNSARMWKISTGEQVRVFGPHTGPVTSVAFGFNGKLAVTSAPNDNIKIWNASTGGLLLSLGDPKQTPGNVSITSDGRTLASARKDGTVDLLAIPSAHIRRTLGHARNPVRTTALGPRGKFLAIGCGRTGVILWNLENGKPAFQTVDRVKPGECPQSADISLAFSADEKTLYSLDASGGLIAQDTRTGEVVRRLPDDPARSRRLAMSPDGRLLATGSLAAIQLWNPEKGELLASLPTGADDFFIMQAVSFSPDSRTLASAVSGTRHASIMVWDIETGKQTLDLADHKDSVTSLIFSPDGNKLASASYDRTIRIWDMKGSAAPQILDNAQSGYSCLSIVYGHDGKRLYCGLENGSIQEWDTTRSILLETRHEHRGGVNSLSITKDGRLLISGSRDGTVRIRDLNRKTPLASVIYIRPGKWLIYTDDGYVDGSEESRNILQWRSGDRVFSHDLAWDFMHTEGLLSLIFSGDDHFRLTNLKHLLESSASAPD